jgi:hypothetical protein
MANRAWREPLGNQGRFQPEQGLHNARDYGSFQVSHRNLPGIMTRLLIKKIRGQSFSRKIRLLIPSSMTNAGENSTPTLLPDRFRTNWDLSSNKTCLIHLQSYQISCHLNILKICRWAMYYIGTKMSWIFVTELVKFELRVLSPLSSRWIVRRSSSCKTESYDKRYVEIPHFFWKFSRSTKGTTIIVRLLWEYFRNSLRNWR